MPDAQRDDCVKAVHISAPREGRVRHRLEKGSRQAASSEEARNDGGRDGGPDGGREGGCRHGARQDKSEWADCVRFSTTDETPTPVSATVRRMRPAARRALTSTEPLCVALKAFEIKLSRIIKSHEPSVHTCSVHSWLTRHSSRTCEGETGRARRRGGPRWVAIMGGIGLGVGSGDSWCLLWARREHATGTM